MKAISLFRTLTLIVLIAMVLGCEQRQQEKTQKNITCPSDQIQVGELCCIDLDDNRVCDTEDAIKNYQNIIGGEDKCQQFEITDPRHPDFCCADLDQDKSCDYLNDLK